MKKHYTTRSYKQRQFGFSLLEVMISMVVTAIGLLGLAGLQAAGLRSNHSAYQHSQATVLAYDMADRMRANVGSVSLYQKAVTTPEQVVECNVAGCSAADLVKNDLFEWTSELRTAFAISDPNLDYWNITLSGSTYTVSVSWDDDRDGDIDGDDPDFQVAFQP